MFIGGAIGAALREIVILAGSTLHGHFPTAILATNLLAAFLIGLVTALTVDKGRFDVDVRLLINTGVMGGLSTFSTMIWGTLMLVRDPEHVWVGVSYLAFSLVAGLVLVVLGHRLGASRLYQKRLR